MKRQKVKVESYGAWQTKGGNMEILTPAVVEIVSN